MFISHLVSKIDLVGSGVVREMYTGLTDFESTSRSSPSPSFEAPVAEAIVDWRSMDGSEIYDRLIQKGAKLEIQANKVIHKSTRTVNHWQLAVFG